MSLLRFSLWPLLAALAGPLPAAVPHGHAHQATNMGLSLDAAGRRWMADTGTVASVRAMQSAVATFERNGGDPAVLGLELQEAMDALIRGCRMTGEAHEQFHRFLERMVEPIHQLQYAPGTDRKAVQDLGAALKQFDEFFEALPE
jgi:hypothetical protein